MGLFNHPMVNTVVKKLWGYNSIDEFIAAEVAGAGINIDEVDMDQVYAYLNANVEYVNDTMDNKIEAALALLNAKVDQRLAELEARVAALESDKK